MPRSKGGSSTASRRYLERLWVIDTRGDLCILRVVDAKMGMYDIDAKFHIESVNSARSAGNKEKQGPKLAFELTVSIVSMVI